MAVVEEPPGRDSAPEEPGPEHAAPGDSAAESPRQQAVPLEAVPTRELLVWMLGVLGAKAWQRMGLVPNPLSGKIERDLPDARAAIDAFSALLEGAKPHLDDRVRRETEALLTTLRLNFVEKSSGS